MEVSKMFPECFKVVSRIFMSHCAHRNYPGKTGLVFPYVAHRALKVGEPVRMSLSQLIRGLLGILAGL